MTRTMTISIILLTDDNDDYDDDDDIKVIYFPTTSHVMQDRNLSEVFGCKRMQINIGNSPHNCQFISYPTRYNF